jgi:hypothetical protein
MPEIKTPIIKLEEGTTYHVGADQYLITEAHTFADIVRFAIAQAGGCPEDILALVEEMKISVGADMLKIRHTIDTHVGQHFNWHGSGVELATGEMDVTFDHGGREYKLLLTDEGPTLT